MFWHPFTLSAEAINLRINVPPELQGVEAGPGTAFLHYIARTTLSLHREKNTFGVLSTGTAYNKQKHILTY